MSQTGLWVTQSIVFNVSILSFTVMSLDGKAKGNRMDAVNKMRYRFTESDVKLLNEIYIRYNNLLGLSMSNRLHLSKNELGCHFIPKTEGGCFEN